MIKMTHARESSHVTKKSRPKRGQKLNLREWRNWSVQLEELTERINPTISVLQSDDQRDRTPRDKSKRTLKSDF